MKRKKIWALVAAGMVLCAVGGGSTLAYLTDQTDTIQNEFTIGDVDIETIDTYTPPEDELVPNEQVEKTVSVKNIGKNDAVVFAEITVPMAECTTVADDGSKGTKTLQDLVFLQQSGDPITLQENHFSDTWELLEDKEDADSKIHTYIFGFKSLLAEGSQADNLFEQYQLRNIIENEVAGGTTLQIGIKSYGIQAANIVGDDGVIDTSVSMEKETLTDIYNHLVRQSGDSDALIQG